jgi:hypothetical protein
MGQREWIRPPAAFLKPLLGLLLPGPLEFALWLFNRLNRGRSCGGWLFGFVFGVNSAGGWGWTLDDHRHAFGDEF